SWCGSWCCWACAGRRHGRACRLRRTVLEVRVLDGDLAALEREHVAAVDFDLLAVGRRAREDPLREAAVAGHEVARVAEVGIREDLEDLREGLAHALASLVARAAGFLARGRLEDAVVGHEGHDEVDVVPVPGLAERFQILDRHHRPASCHMKPPVVARRTTAACTRGLSASEWAVSTPITWSGRSIRCTVGICIRLEVNIGTPTAAAISCWKSARNPHVVVMARQPAASSSCAASMNGLSSAGSCSWTTRRGEAPRTTAKRTGKSKVVAL